MNYKIATFLVGKLVSSGPSGLLKEENNYEKAELAINKLSEEGYEMEFSTSSVANGATTMTLLTVIAKKSNEDQLESE